MDSHLLSPTMGMVGWWWWCQEHMQGAGVGVGGEVEKLSNKKT